MAMVRAKALDVSVKDLNEWLDAFREDYWSAHQRMTRKYIVSYETHEVYRGVNVAAEALGVSPASVTTSLRSFGRKSAGGQHWFYL